MAALIRNPIEILEQLEAAKAADQRELLESAVNTTLRFSREVEIRERISPDILQAIATLIFELFVKTNQYSDKLSELDLQLLRCVGNLVADNNSIRDIFLATPDAVERLATTIEIKARGPQGRQYASACLAVQVAFNLCNDYDVAQRALLAEGADMTVLQHIHHSSWFKDVSLDLAIELLGLLSQHVNDVKPQYDYGKEEVNQILCLPCLSGLDDETFLDRAAAIQSYLQYEPVQLAIIDTRQLNKAFELLERTVLMFENSPEAEPGRAFEAHLMRTITDISALPSFPYRQLYPESFLSKLCDRCILTEANADSANLAICSCILLGNHATNPKAAPEIISLIRMDGLYDFITLKAYGRSRASNATVLPDHSEYLHAAAGMLRHLALPAELKQQYFHDSASKQIAVALAQYPHVEVQIAGLRLLRQLLVDSTDAFHQTMHNSSHTTLLRIFSDPASDSRVKLEISRTMTALLREAAKVTSESAQQQAGGPHADASTPTDLHDDVSALLNAPDLFEPLIYAVTESKLAFAQAEGYLGLCLILRCSPDAGAAQVSALMQSRPELPSALRSQICVSSKKVDEVQGQMEKLAVTGGGDEGSLRDDELPLQGPKTETPTSGVTGRARDNAIILLSDLLKSEGISDEVRDQLDSIANEAGITLRLDS